jgi:hypothetical protein
MGKGWGATDSLPQEQINFLSDNNGTEIIKQGNTQSWAGTTGDILIKYYSCPISFGDGFLGLCHFVSRSSKKAQNGQ